MSPSRHKHTGAALIVCLMLLLIMTLIGVSAITSSTMQEKMAGNVLNKHLSFQAAETALRTGETVAAGLAADAVFNGTGGLYPRTNVDDVDYPVWENAANWVDVASDPALAQQPQYIIENFGIAPRDANCMLEVPLKAGCLLPVYRVSAQGWGLNTNAVSLIQTTYKQL
ncbi:MAG TPA: PilX N-terminal domain-containing pilus assembly protein [Gammaproteobacteria bacterium]|nr:PilX N-terminal domain-containing pilus assembly protein [Gammaproteobacteria bacterium]